MRIGERDGAALRAAPRASNSFTVRIGLMPGSHGGLRGWRALQSPTGLYPTDLELIPEVTRQRERERRVRRGIREL